jgi:arylsulfatase A-like enzyme
MLTELDRGIGAVLDALRRKGIAERTFVFFFSDNGPTDPGSCGPLRGKKGSLWECGHRVPAVAWWPGRIAAGATSAELSIGMDLVPTMLALAGIDPPAERPLDGLSLLPVLLDGESLGERRLFWEDGGQQAMRHGRWKLVRKAGGAEDLALFDLADDLSEQNDVSARQPERVAQMLAELQAWKRDVTTGATRQPDRK